MKQIIAIFLIFVLLITTTPNAYAGFGAGTSKGWPNTTDGARGKVVAPLYKTPPSAYTAGEKITIVFNIENPENNNKTIATDLFLHIWKVEKNNPETQSLSEDQLNKNHTNKKDSQSLYRVIPVGELSLKRGEISEFKATFTIDAAGYYQFDLTNLNQSTYIPGHIYAAGFLRIKAAEAQGILGAKTLKEESSISGVLLLFSVLALVLGMLLFFLWKKRGKKNNASLL